MGFNIEGKIKRNPDMEYINKLQRRIEQLEALEISKKKKQRKPIFSGVMGEILPFEYWNMK